MDLVLGDDREALRVLYQRHAALILGLVVSVVRDKAVAEEVVQDVFVRAWTKASSYRQDRASVLTWLARIARNRAIDVLRQQKKSVRPWDLQTNEQRLPEESFEFAQEQQNARSAVDQLSAEQRRVLALAFYQGKTHQEIADQLKEPLGTVKSRIRDSLLKLREKLGPGRK